jgi:hypothetical protein
MWIVERAKTGILILSQSLLLQLSTCRHVTPLIHIILILSQSLLLQLSTCRHVTPLRHIILILSQSLLLQRV